jgi:hypothetical protein
VAVAIKITSGGGVGTLIPIGDGLIVGRDVAPPGNLAGDQQLAGRHAQFRPTGDTTAVLETLGSPSATEVNGRPVTGPTQVTVGDRIVLGATTLQVELVPSEARSAPQPGAGATQIIPSLGGSPFPATWGGSFATPGAAGPAVPSSTVPSPPSPAWQQPGASPAASSTKSGKTALAVLGVLILAGGGFAAGFFTGDNNSSKKSASASSTTSANSTPTSACVAADSGRSGPGHFRYNTSACENGTLDVTAFTLPIHRGTSKGKTVWYVVMDTSNRATSARLGVNFAPKLANAKRTKAVQRVTVAPDGTVDFPGTVDFNHKRVLTPSAPGFPPAPGARPPAVADAQYSPLIQLPSGVVENAPQIANDSGQADKVITIDKAKMTVVFRAQHGFYENKSVHYASFDASDPTVAAIEDVTYAPNLNAAPKANDENIKTSAREQLIAFLNGPASPGNNLDQGVNFALLTGGDNPSPLNLLHETPVLPNHADVGSLDYTPMWDVHFAVWTQAAIDAGDRTQYRNVDTVLDNLVASVDGAPPLVTGPGGKRYGAAGVIVNCPLVSIDIP